MPLRILGPLIGLIYIDDLSNTLSSNAKMCATETSLFTVIHGKNTSGNELNDNLPVIKNWAFQWKMNFIMDPSKQA